MLERKIAANLRLVIFGLIIAVEKALVTPPTPYPLQKRALLVLTVIKIPRLEPNIGHWPIREVYYRDQI